MIICSSCVYLYYNLKQDMNKVEFLVEYEDYKEICKGNAPNICDARGIKYSDYRRAINGYLPNEALLSKIMDAIRDFVRGEILKASPTLQKSVQMA